MILFSFIRGIFKSLKTPNMKCFTKTVNGLIQSTISAQISILNVSLGGEYVSDYPEAFFIIFN